MSILVPIGTFLTSFDTAISTAQTAAVSGLVAVMGAPLGLMVVIYFCVMGLRVASGDLSRLNGFVFDIIKIGIIAYLATNLTAFNYWVTGVFEHGFPDAISQAVTAGADTQSGTINGVAASIDKIWTNLWSQVGSVWMRAGTLDVSSRLIAAGIAVLGGIGLLLDAGVYLIARFLFAIVVVLGPVAIACAMFNATRPIFERWIGKGVALIVLQVAAVITMQIVFTGSTTFIIAPANATPDLPHQLQNLISTVIWILMGAFAIYSLPSLAYSIGTGIAVTFQPIVAAAIAAADVAGVVGSAFGGQGEAPALSDPPGDYNLSFARAELADAGGAPDAGPPRSQNGAPDGASALFLPPPFIQE